MVVDLNVMTATGSCTWCEGRAIQQFADDTALTIIDRRADQIAAHVTHIFIVAAHIITAEESILCMQHTLQRWHSWRRLAQPCSTWQSLSTKVLGPQQKQRCRTAAGRTPGASCTTRCDNSLYDSAVVGQNATRLFGLKWALIVPAAMHVDL